MNPFAHVHLHYCHCLLTPTGASKPLLSQHFVANMFTVSPVMLFVFIRCVGKPKLEQRELLLFNIHRECLLTIILASSKTIMQHFVMCRKMTVERQSEKVISA